MDIRSLEDFAVRMYAGKRIMLTPYAYSATFTALAQNATQTLAININANADFILCEMSARAAIGAAQNQSTVTAPFIRTLIVDTGSNEQFSNQAVDVINYMSSAQKDNPLPYFRIIQGRTALNITVTNYAPVAETYSGEVFLSGVQVRAY